MWRVLGRLLPESIRDLVYEPAYLDLWRNHSLRRNREALPAYLSLGVRFVGCFAAVLWYSVPAYLVDRDRLRPAGRVVVVGAMILALLVVVSLAPWIAGAITHNSVPK